MNQAAAVLLGAPHPNRAAIQRNQAQATRGHAPRADKVGRSLPRVQPGADNWHQLPLLIHGRDTAHSVKGRGSQPRRFQTQEVVWGEFVVGQAQQVLGIYVKEK